MHVGQSLCPVLQQLQQASSANAATPTFRLASSIQPAASAGLWNHGVRQRLLEQHIYLEKLICRQHVTNLLFLDCSTIKSSSSYFRTAAAKEEEFYKLLPANKADHLCQLWQSCSDLHKIQTVHDIVENPHSIRLSKNMTSWCRCCL